MLYLSKQLYQSSEIERKDTRSGYGDALLEIGERNKQVVVLTADLAESMRVQGFQQKFPARFFEMGVAEQNMMGVAAGLALSGKIPFVSSYAVFSPGRSWDQLRVSVCYSKANVKVVGGHTGVTVGADGATHQALEDIAITRVLPNMTVVVPCDYWEAKKATQAISDLKGPTYLRLTREKTPVMTSEQTPFVIGKAYVMREGKDVTIVGCGHLLHEALLAAADLEREGISVEVINNHTVKPLDAPTLLHSINKTRAVVTVEEHQVMGGMGSAIAELCVQHQAVPIEMIGMHDKFGQSGEADELLQFYHMTRAHIVHAVKTVLQRKQK